VPDWLAGSDLLLAGGWVMAAILTLSFVMWVLILDRYLCLVRTRRRLVAETAEMWRALSGPGRLVNRRLREALNASFESRLASGMITIEVISTVLPLLGLLGTVTGMIKTFDVMTAFGTGNVRGMAEGISQALITTMAGLMTALTGMYFVGDLRSRIERESERLRQHLGGMGRREAPTGTAVRP
jgi:biopolymer transport protein ExbB